MSETIGAFTVDAAEGVLTPAHGVFSYVNPSPPPPDLVDSGAASPVVSKITSVRAFATAADALTEANNYRAAVGYGLAFRTVACFVADVEPQIMTAKGDAGPATLVAVWSLLADLGWAP